MTADDKIKEVMHLVMMAMNAANARATFQFQLERYEAIRAKLEEILGE